MRVDLLGPEGKQLVPVAYLTHLYFREFDYWK